MDGKVMMNATTNQGISTPRSPLCVVSVFAVLVAVAAAGRLLPHPPNFTPVAAAALFAGFFFSSRAVATAVPLLAMLATDAVIGFYDLPVMATVYGCLLMPAFLRPFLGRLHPLRIMGCSVASSAIFFVVTNFAVWAASGMYAHTVAGLAQCFEAAIPFFRHTLSGDLVWSGVFFGTYCLIAQLADARKLAGRCVVQPGPTVAGSVKLA